MREIKWDTPYFKVWDGDKFWGKSVCPVNGIDEMYCGDVQDLLFLRPTGLKDKNGVEIYEGDILQDYEYDRIGVVSFEKGAFVVTCENEVCDVFEWSGEGVIGNIYENPELLEQKNG